MAIRKGSSYRNRPEHKKTARTRAFEHALDIEMMILDRIGDLGISKKELASRMELSPSGLSNFLNGQPNMTLETMSRFELALDAEFSIALTPVEALPYRISVEDPGRFATEAPVKTDRAMSYTVVSSSGGYRRDSSSEDECETLINMQNRGELTAA